MGDGEKGEIKEGEEENTGPPNSTTALGLLRTGSSPKRKMGMRRRGQSGPPERRLETDGATSAETGGQGKITKGANCS